MENTNPNARLNSGLGTGQSHIRTRGQQSGSKSPTWSRRCLHISAPRCRTATAPLSGRGPDSSYGPAVRARDAARLGESMPSRPWRGGSSAAVRPVFAQVRPGIPGVLQPCRPARNSSGRRAHRRRRGVAAAAEQVQAGRYGASEDGRQDERCGSGGAGIGVFGRGGGGGVSTLGGGGEQGLRVVVMMNRGERPAFEIARRLLPE